MLLYLPSPSPYLPTQNPKAPRITKWPLLLQCSTTFEPQPKPDSAIQRISEKLRRLGHLSLPNAEPNSQTQSLNAGEIFIPTPHELPKHRVGHTIDVSWSTPESPIPVPGTGILRFRELWKKQKEEINNMNKENGSGDGRVPMVAELVIDKGELKRLRRAGIRIEKRLKVGKAGITEGIVNGIHERWINSELVKIKCEDLCRMNMKRTHEVLERKTGGLVVWRSGSIIILYRGANYKYPYFHNKNQAEDPNTINDSSPDQDKLSSNTIAVNPSTTAVKVTSSANFSSSKLVNGVGSPNKVRLQLPGEVQFEEEADRLLDGLGPRFTDWWGYNPLPVDADLLPAIVPGFRKPFRLLPFGIKPKLTDREMTILKRLSRPMPCHFALGRNRNLQGLAVSMIKLWEKCEVAKIAVKRGVQNTNSRLMAEELKNLTGGVLLSRDREFFTFYRGKDFLPSAVSTAIEERRNSEYSKPKMSSDTPIYAADSASVDNKIKSKKPITSAISRVETKLTEALEKKERAEKLLVELENLADPPHLKSDKEAITQEERYMLRKIGLRMKPFLLLGRRGVFAGTVENMHLHWKYRELVKVISKEKFTDVENEARLLEAESGGILVAVEKVNKGYAIIMYRGKNYKRPSTLRPNTLLNKKQAMKRSLEAQRCASLKLHVLSLSKSIDHLQHQMVDERDARALNDTGESDTDDDTNENNFSIEQDRNCSENSCNKENSEEVNEAYSENLYSNNKSSDGLMESALSSNLEECKPKVPVFSNSDLYHSFNVDDEEEEEEEEEEDDANEEEENSLSNSDQSKPDLHVSNNMLKCDPEFENMFRAAPLSNREKLILRKQALKTKKRPVLAVGRNNIVTGVAKTIMTHFKKYPLAIVNIKGVAKGTSVQEVIFQLEQATGAVLVSREPSKVILYRGWGMGEVPGGNVKKEDPVIKDDVSPELIEAIRIECGLSPGRED